MQIGKNQWPPFKSEARFVYFVPSTSGCHWNGFTWRNWPALGGWKEAATKGNPLVGRFRPSTELSCTRALCFYLQREKLEKAAPLESQCECGCLPLVAGSWLHVPWRAPILGCNLFANRKSSLQLSFLPLRSSDD